MVVFSTNYHKTIAGLERIWVSQTNPKDDVVGFGRGINPSPNYDYLSNANPFTIV